MLALVLILSYLLRFGKNNLTAKVQKIADLMNNPLYFNKKQATSSRLPVLNIILYSAY